LLKTAFGRKHNIISDYHNKSYPMGSVLISALRLVDVFSDDSNFRSSFMTNTVRFLLSNYFHYLLSLAFSLELFSSQDNALFLTFFLFHRFAGSLSDPDPSNSP
jgi:hypothetical protein